MADTQAKIVLAAEDRTSRVFAGLRSNLGVLQSQVDATKRSFLGLAPSIVGAFGVAGISAFFGRVVDGVDKLNDLADATGSSVERLSGLEDIGARTGTSIETIGDAVVKLQKNLLEAQDPTSQAAALFKQLGLNADELSKIDPSDALLRVAEALSGFEQNANKGQFQIALLGKNTRELAPFLKDLAEAGQINATVTKQQAEEAEQFNKQLFQIQKNSTDAARSLVADLLPKINALTQGTADAAGGFSLLGVAANGIKTTFEAVAVLGLNVGFVLTSVGREAGAIAAQVAALARLDFKGFTAISEAVKEDGVRARAELEKLSAQILGTAAKTAGAAAAAASKPDIGKTAEGTGKPKAAAKERLSDAQRYLENLQRQLQGTQDLSVAETVLADIQAGRLKLAKGESAQPLLDIAQQIDDAKRRQDQLKAEAEQVRQLRAEQERLKSAGEAVFEATRTPAEAFGRELAKIQDLLQRGAIDTDTYYRRVAQLREEFDKLESAKDTIDEIDSFTQRAAQNIQDTLGSSLADVLDGNFKNIGDSFTKMLNRMVAEAAAAQISRALFGDLLDGGKQSGGTGDSGFLGGLLKSGASALSGFGSSLLGSIRGGAATGSNLIERDMVTLLHKGEAVVPKAYNPAAGGSGGRSVVINLYQTVQPGATRATSLQAAADARRQLELATRNL